MTTSDSERAEVLHGKTPSEFANEWYRENEIHHSIQRRSLTDKNDPSFIPCVIDSPEFSSWLTKQYRFAMAKGIGIGQRSLESTLTATKEQLAAAESELKSIDAVIARRSALNKPTRLENIEHALNCAGKFKDELAVAKAECDQLREVYDSTRDDINELQAKLTAVEQAREQAERELGEAKADAKKYFSLWQGAKPQD